MINYMSINDKIAVVPISDDGTVTRTGETVGRLEIIKKGDGLNRISYRYQLIDRLKSDSRIIGTPMDKKINLVDTPATYQLDENGDQLLDGMGDPIIDTPAGTEFSDWMFLKLLDSLGEQDWGGQPISAFTADTSMTITGLLELILGGNKDLCLGALLEAGIYNGISKREGLI